jgi:hypothetical protein
VERHLLGCESCREYHHFSGTLPQVAQADLEALLSREKRDLSTRILNGMERADSAQHGRKGRRPLLAAAFSASAAVAALLLGFVLLRPAAPDLSQLNPFPEWRSAESSLSGLVKNMDSPYRNELKNLQSSLNATVDFFRSFLDINLGTEE